MSEDTTTPQPDSPSKGRSSAEGLWWVVPEGALLFAPVFSLCWLALCYEGRGCYFACVACSAVVALGVLPKRWALRQWEESPCLRWVVCLTSVVCAALASFAAESSPLERAGAVWICGGGAGILLYTRWLRPPNRSLFPGVAWIMFMGLYAWDLTHGMDLLGLLPRLF